MWVSRVVWIGRGARLSNHLRGSCCGEQVTTFRRFEVGREVPAGGDSSDECNLALAPALPVCGDANPPVAPLCTGD